MAVHLVGMQLRGGLHRTAGLARHLETGNSVNTLTTAQSNCDLSRNRNKINLFTSHIAVHIASYDYTLVHACTTQRRLDVSDGRNRPTPTNTNASPDPP